MLFRSTMRLGSRRAISARKSAAVSRSVGKDFSSRRRASRSPARAWRVTRAGAARLARVAEIEGDVCAPVFAPMSSMPVRRDPMSPRRDGSENVLRQRARTSDKLNLFLHTCLTTDWQKYFCNKISTLGMAFS